MNIKIPPYFFHDHWVRDLPTPQVIKETAQYVEIDTDDPAFRELCDDVEFYCTPHHFENCYRNPALALRKSMRKQGVWPL